MTLRILDRKNRLVPEQRSDETIHALAEAEKNIKNAVEVNNVGRLDNRPFRYRSKSWVVDFGCGMESYATRLVEKGADVTDTTI